MGSRISSQFLLRYLPTFLYYQKMIKELIRGMHKSEEMCCVDSKCYASDRETLVSCLSYNAPRREFCIYGINVLPAVTSLKQLPTMRHIISELYASSDQFEVAPRQSFFTTLEQVAKKMAITNEVTFALELFKCDIEHGKGVNERKVVRGVYQCRWMDSTCNTCRRKCAALELLSESAYSSPLPLNLRKCDAVTNHRYVFLFSQQLLNGSTSRTIENKERFGFTIYI